MAKICCKHHQDRNLLPVMIHFGEITLGKQYICAVCSRVRVFNIGEIVSLKGQYGFIDGQKDNLFFHFSNLSYDFAPYVGMIVSFEASFLEDNRVQAINVKPFKEEKNGY